MIKVTGYTIYIQENKGKFTKFSLYENVVARNDGWRNLSKSEQSEYNERAEQMNIKNEFFFNKEDGKEYSSDL